MAGNGLDDKVRCQRLRELCDEGMPEIVKAEPGQLGFVPQRPPRSVPLTNGLGRVELVPATGEPQVVVWRRGTLVLRVVQSSQVLMDIADRD
jgi:hypothetical protein